MAMQDHFIVPYSGLNHSVTNLGELYKVYYDITNDENLILDRVKRRG